MTAKARTAVYVIAALLTFAVFVLVLSGVITSDALERALTATILFADGLVSLLARAHVTPD